MRNLDIADSRSKLEAYAGQPLEQGQVLEHGTLFGELEVGGGDVIADNPAVDAIEETALEAAPSVGHDDVMPADPKDVLKSYLQGARDTLLWKLDGVSERDQRLPRTPTGMNLLGIVKHALHSEVVYFGPTFGREWPTPEELVPADETDPQAEWHATAQESSAGLVDLYRRVQAFADETIDASPLDAIGHVAHWGGAEVTLHEILVHKTVDLQRHAGHADIVREQIDGSTGLLRQNSNLPDDVDWPAYVAKLTALAERF